MTDKQQLLVQSQDDMKRLCKTLGQYRGTSEFSSKEEDRSWIRDILSHLGNIAIKSWFTLFNKCRWPSVGYVSTGVWNVV